MSYLTRVMSGEERGPAARVLRLATSIAEPIYSAVVTARNRSFDSGRLAACSLGRPTISVGNITTGGTGKTPVIRWLARRLREEGRHVAILARGYKSTAGEAGDEQQMLENALNAGQARRVQLVCNPDRVSAAARVLTDDPTVDLFLLDDGFQHRKAARELDLVLISAPSPFGHGHVLPRGLLREPLSGFGRAGACILTHSDQVGEESLAKIEAQIRKHHRGVPIYRTVHWHTALLDEADPASRRASTELDRTPFFAFAGIGDPDRLHHQLSAHGSTYRGYFWFPDHYRYSSRDLSDLELSAKQMGARALVTTEKDWAKIARLPREKLSLPIWRIEMEIRFSPGHEERLWQQIVRAIG